MQGCCLTTVHVGRTPQDPFSKSRQCKIVAIVPYLITERELSDNAGQCSAYHVVRFFFRVPVSKPDARSRGRDVEGRATAEEAWSLSLDCIQFFGMGFQHSGVL